MQRLKAFWRDHRGATAIEYVVISAVVSIVIIAGTTRIGANIKTLFLYPVANNLS